ncbi:hypothetical protein LPJ75_005021, partial [Coemansia sp. RSA 2598]
EEWRSNPANVVPTAWLTYPGASPAHLPRIRAQILSALGFPTSTPRSSPADPIHCYVFGRSESIGVVLTKPSFLATLVAKPLTFSGRTIPWTTPHGSLCAFAVIGAPPTRERRHVLGVLRQYGRVLSADRLDLDGEKTSDWHGFIALPEGQQLPRAFRFMRQREDTRLMPLAEAEPCPTCRQRLADLCGCPAPRCHRLLVESRMAQQVEASRAAIAPTVAAAPTTRTDDAAPTTAAVQTTEDPDPLAPTSSDPAAMELSASPVPTAHALPAAPTAGADNATLAARPAPATQATRTNADAQAQPAATAPAAAAAPAAVAAPTAAAAAPAAVAAPTTAAPTTAAAAPAAAAAPTDAAATPTVTAAAATVRPAPHALPDMPLSDCDAMVTDSSKDPHSEPDAMSADSTDDETSAPTPLPPHPRTRSSTRTAKLPKPTTTEASRRLSKVQKAPKPNKATKDDLGRRITKSGTLIPSCSGTPVPLRPETPRPVSPMHDAAPD